MTQEPSHTASLDPLIARVIDECGEVVIMELDADRVEELIQRLGPALGTALGGEFTEVTVRMVLGSACTTAAKAIDHFVAALQLPYGATQGWADFREALDDRSAKAECVVVANASQLLKYEDYDLWQELVDNLHHDQRSGCLYRGWNTLVLVDSPNGWSEWAFRSYTAEER